MWWRVFLHDVPYCRVIGRDVMICAVLCCVAIRDVRLGCVISWCDVLYVTGVRCVISCYIALHCDVVYCNTTHACFVDMDRSVMWYRVMVYHVAMHHVVCV